MADSKMALCAKCRLEKAADAGFQRHAGGAWVCHECHATANYLNRLNLPSSLTTMSEEARLDFFRSASELRDSSGRICLEKVKVSLSRVLRHVLTKQMIDAYHAPFLPLSAWEQKGFDVEKIEKETAEKDKEEHPVAGRNA